eukprot:CAMPEP_0183404086 /NCGR_PEP_ID=MMETSP0370-20130417/14970_1 /TAXON_ID=268820 /ORGANISM="Peridinium aciculiferum, Strain PAER-2" /LENGTH=56 /DNA_ID=CAMNT_0025585907 /DNA_START=225 /DNA_END=395 /DNA_ORIENTATION=-
MAEPSATFTRQKRRGGAAAAAPLPPLGVPPPARLLLQVAGMPESIGVGASLGGRGG